MHYILWDVDGVLNPFESTDLHERGFVRFNKEYISWALDIVHHAEWLRYLEFHASFVWASSWGSETNALCGWFGLKNIRYPHIPLSTSVEHQGSWKLPSIQKWVTENVSESDSVVWVDDELYDDAAVWAASLPNVLLIPTDPAAGLTYDEFLCINDFIKR